MKRGLPRVITKGVPVSRSVSHSLHQRHFIPFRVLAKSGLGTLFSLSRFLKLFSKIVPEQLTRAKSGAFLTFTVVQTIASYSQREHDRASQELEGNQEVANTSSRPNSSPRPVWMSCSPPDSLLPGTHEPGPITSSLNQGQSGRLSPSQQCARDKRQSQSIVSSADVTLWHDLQRVGHGPCPVSLPNKGDYERQNSVDWWEHLYDPVTEGHVAASSAPLDGAPSGGPSGPVQIASGPSTLPLTIPRSTLHILDLPPPLLHEIMRHLEARDLGRVSCCSRILNQLALESPGWQRYYCERWRPPTQAATARAQATSDTAQTPSRSLALRAPLQLRSASSAGGRPGDAPGRVTVTGQTLHDTWQQQSGSPEWWRQLYLHKERRSAALQGRYDSDWFTGHTAGVRAVAVLPQAPMAVSAGYDSTVRIWDLDRMVPLAASAPLGETLRSAAVDWDFLAVGGTDCIVRVWPLAIGCPHFFDVDGLWDKSDDLSCTRARQQTSTAVGGSESPRHSGYAFPESASSSSTLQCNVSAGLGATCSPYVPSLLCGHSGPVSCLAAQHSAGSSPRLYSGSWDGTVLCWDVDRAMVCPEVVPSEGVRSRRRLRRRPGFTPCVPGPGTQSEALMGRFQHADWVWAVVAKSGHLFSVAGARQYSWDVETGALLRAREGVHNGKASAVEATMSGHYVFTAGEDGYVRMFDERVKGRERRRGPSGGDGEEPTVQWLAHGSSINSLAFEDPWLVSASSDGCCSVMEVGKSARADKRHAKHALSSCLGAGPSIPTYEPARRIGGGYGSVLSVDIGHERVISGCVDTTVRVLDFRGADVNEKGRRGRRKKERERRMAVAHEG